MGESFQIRVFYKGKELLFNAKLIILGYTHKIQVKVNGQDVLFEPDEERNYRAVVYPSNLENTKKIDSDLLKAISETIHSILSGE